MSTLSKPGQGAVQSGWHCVVRSWRKAAMVLSGFAATEVPCLLMVSIDV